MGLLGAVIDVKTGSGLRTVFSVSFVTGSVLAALLVNPARTWSRPYLCHP